MPRRLTLAGSQDGEAVFVGFSCAKRKVLKTQRAQNLLLFMILTGFELSESQEICQFI
jgi:hypothetical protein